MRDYSKFLKPDGRFDVRFVPRPVYTRVIKAYRQQPDVIEEVFYGLYWHFDLEEEERKLTDVGAPVDRATIAEKMLGTMSDNEWWEALQAFEAHFQQHFHESPQRWAEFLDPIYDEQEAAGWISRQ